MLIVEEMRALKRLPSLHVLIYKSVLLWLFELLAFLHCAD